MNAADIFEIVKHSKKYCNICDETILRICENEIVKYKSEKEVVKSVKAGLHQISGAYIGENEIKRAYKLLEDISRENMQKDRIEEILRLHASTMERIDFLREMYEDIFTCVENCSVILDIACGLNPFSLGLLDRYDIKNYYAADINNKCIELIGHFFHIYNINGEAFSNDVLYKIPEYSADNTFLFKILPLLEQQKRGYSKKLVEGLSSRFFTITFPTKSLSGKNTGMYASYKKFMEETFSASDFEYCMEKEYKNELMFIIRRRRG